jgi:hypothetical protein
MLLAAELKRTIGADPARHNVGWGSKWYQERPSNDVNAESISSLGELLN